MIKISFVGDLMCEKEQLFANTIDGKYDFTSIFACIKPAFNSSDYVVGNLETPIAGEGLEYSNRKWSFNTPIEYAQVLKDIGFDLVSTANNHCLDRGVEGAINTLNNLDKVGLDHVGTNRSIKERETIFIKQVKDLKIAFLSYTYGTNASFNKHYLDKSNSYLVNLFRAQEPLPYKYYFRGHHRILRYIDRIKSSMLFSPYIRNLNRDIKKAKKNADFVVVLMHSGGQYNLIPDKWTRTLQDHMIKQGVDAVIGCHPHVVHEGLIYPSKQVGFYSLGNFCAYPGKESAGGQDLKTKSEYSVILHLHISSTTRKIEKITFQIAKSVVEADKKSYVYLLYDLINKEKDAVKKEQLIQDNSLIVGRFLKSTNKFDPKEEYDYFIG